MKKFPVGFYWGAATASYQVEGGINNCDWAKAAREGRVPVCGQACDHYHRYEEDFDIAKSLGHNVHRFSLEWARIEPEEGKFNLEEIEHYRQVLSALKARGLTPIVTLWHFTLPLWFFESGGFERKDAPEIFARYARFIAQQLGSELGVVSTINEPIVFAGLGWLKGNWPPFKQHPFVIEKNQLTYSGDRNTARPSRSWWNFVTYFKVVNNLIKAHRLAYDAIKSVAPYLDVNLVHHVVAYDANHEWKNRLRVYIQDLFVNQYLLKRVYKKCDSLGLNFYHYVKYGDRPIYKKTDMGWEMVPEGIYNAINVLWRYHLPIYICEAGIADADDSDRAEYITKEVSATWRAISEGVMVKSFIYWSLLDNYEWALGFDKKFGLVEINYDTLERTIRPSAYVYKQICETNAVVE